MKCGQEITPTIADKLTLGLMTDTAKLRFLKSDTLKNLATLMSFGADFDKILSICHLSKKDGYGQGKILDMISQQTNEMYSKQGTDLEIIKPTEYDELLSKIFKRTNKLSKEITPEILDLVSILRDNGANYEYLLKDFKTFEEFMLRNEILSRVKICDHQSKQQNVKISLSLGDVEQLKQKYNVTEQQILDTISIFANIDVVGASISLPDGKKSSIDNNRNISIETEGIGR